MIEKNPKVFENYLIMSLDDLNEKIAKQEERLKQLKAQKQATLAREKSKQKEQERKDNTRRKILAGSCVLKLANEDPEAHVRLMRQLDKYLTESRDRQLFDL